MRRLAPIRFEPALPHPLPADFLSGFARWVSLRNPIPTQYPHSHRPRQRSSRGAIRRVVPHSLRFGKSQSDLRLHTYLFTVRTRARKERNDRFWSTFFEFYPPDAWVSLGKLSTSASMEIWLQTESSLVRTRRKRIWTIRSAAQQHPRPRPLPAPRRAVQKPKKRRPSPPLDLYVPLRDRPNPERDRQEREYRDSIYG
jgi:hypothetical protein